MSLSNHVDLVITEDAVSVPRAGFGVPGVLSYNATWPERVRFYTRPSEVAADGFALDSPEYLAVNAMSSQSPRPSRMAILRGTLAPTLTYTVNAIDIRDEFVYAIRVRGQGVTETLVQYESAAAAFRAEIHAGIVEALNDVAGANYTAAFAALSFATLTIDTVDTTDNEVTTTVAHGLLTGDGPVRLETSGTLPAGLNTGTDYWIIREDATTVAFATTLANAIAGTRVNITDTGTGTHTIVSTASTVSPDAAFTVTGDAAGEWFALEILDVSALSAYQSHADPGVATDLAAIQLEDDSWFWLVTLYNSEAYVNAASTWIQGQKKFYIAGSSDTRDLGASTGTAGALDVLAATGRTQTAGLYHHAPAQFADAGLTGTLAPREPGSWTAKFKRITGATPSPLTATHRTNLVARHANFYEAVAGVNIVSEGTTAAGPTVLRGFIDTVVALFWLEDDMAKGVFGTLAGAPKIPRTDEGMVQIESQVQATLQRAVTRTIAASDPEPGVEVPRIADMADLLPRGVRLFFSFTLAGAIHSVKPVTGVVIL